VAGVTGATAAGLGVFLPVYAVVVLLAPSYKRWAKNPQLNPFVLAVTAAAVDLRLDYGADRRRYAGGIVQVERAGTGGDCGGGLGF
jgi:chromate transporter